MEVFLVLSFHTECRETEDTSGGSMQNILVTGGCGFIGANFIRLLFNEPDFKARIINVDKLTYAGNPENLTDVEEAYPERYVFVLADICDARAMTEVFTKYNID